QQFEERQVHKIYWTLTERTPQTQTGRIHAPIGRDPQQRKRMAVVRAGKEAITNFQVLEMFSPKALLEIYLEQGRTHQIRVHLAYIGCPVVGDKVYGYRKQQIKVSQTFLHAKSIRFAHPITGENCFFETDLPNNLQQILEQLRHQ